MRSTLFALAAGAALASALGACAPGSESPGGGGASARPFALPFVENDFSAALARAREADLPLFVEVWAPW